MSTFRDMRRLMTLAAMVKDDEMAKIAALRAEMATLRDRIAALRSAGSDTDPSLSYLQTGADDKWRLWCRQEIARLNRELAILRAQEPEQEQKTRVALARTQVLDRIAFDPAR